MVRGEPGRILENFMGTYLQVKIFKEIKNFGNFLDYKYYITDFKELRNHANKILQDSSSYSNLIKKNKYKFYLFALIVLYFTLSFFQCYDFFKKMVNTNNFGKACTQEKVFYLKI